MFTVKTLLGCSVKALSRQNGNGGDSIVKAVMLVVKIRAH